MSQDLKKKTAKQTEANKIMVKNYYRFIYLDIRTKSVNRVECVRFKWRVKTLIYTGP